MFKTRIENLSKFEQNEFKMFTEECKSIMETYPTVTNWIKWFLNPIRADILFPACQKKGIKQQLMTMSKDTNAQENIGKQFQNISLKAKIGIGEALELSLKITRMLMIDRKSILSGHTYNYRPGNKKRPFDKKRSSKTMSSDSAKKQMTQKYHNDGRAPDTTEKLLDNDNVCGHVNADISFDGFFWGFTRRNGQVVFNTCNVDVPLNLLYSIDLDMKNRGKSLLSHLPDNHLVCRSFKLTNI